MDLLLHCFSLTNSWAALLQQDFIKLLTSHQTLSTYFCSPPAALQHWGTSISIIDWANVGCTKATFAQFAREIWKQFEVQSVRVVCRLVCGPFLLPAKPSHRGRHKVETICFSTCPGSAFWACEQATRWLSAESWLPLSLGREGWHSLTHNPKAGPLFRTCTGPFYPHPFHVVLLGEVLQGLAQPGLSKAIRANYRYPVTGALGQARWGAQRPGRRAGVSLGQKDKATLGPILSECLPGSMNW